MAQFLNTPWISTPVPGAYVNTTVISNASGLATSGVILIMGEAAGGPDYTQVTLANNFYGPTSLNQVRAIYTSGPIVDAFAALSAPSNDPDIVGTASSIYIIKTNRGTQASHLVDTNYGTFHALNYGVGGNLYNYTITSLDGEVAPQRTSSTVPAFGAPLNGATFAIRLEGGASTSVALSATPALHNSIATLVTELNTVLPAGIVATASIASPLTAFTLTIAADAAAYRKGWGKSFELIDSVPGELAALGLLPGLTVSSQEPGVETQIINSAIGFNEVFNTSADIALFVGYQGTTATITVGAVNITTAVTGGSGSNLSIPVGQFTTIGTLAAFINSQPGYSAAAAPAANSLPVSSLDQVTAIGICSTAASIEPGRIKDAAYRFQQNMNSSTAFGFAPTAVAGIPAPGSLAYLSGGTRGPTLAADIVAAIAQMAGVQVNIIVPLFSQNASADIIVGNTDPASTYTIDAINELLKSHCIQYSTPTLKRNRTAILSYNDTYANCKAQAQSLASYRCSLTCQQVTQVNSAGANQLFLPWYASCIAAGMQAGGFYKSICNHLANVVSFQNPVGYDAGDPADVADAIIAGLLVLSQNTSGIPWVSDQTTYGLDSNFVYNSIQAVYLSDILALDLAQSFQTAIVGKSVADVSAASALSFLQQKFDFYKKLKMTTTSNEAPLGYRNASIQISAPSMFVQVEAKLTTSIYFVAIDLALSAVQQSAS